MLTDSSDKVNTIRDELVRKASEIEVRMDQALNVDMANLIDTQTKQSDAATALAKRVADVEEWAKQQTTKGATTYQGQGRTLLNP